MMLGVLMCAGRPLGLLTEDYAQSLFSADPNCYPWDFRTFVVRCAVHPSVERHLLRKQCEIHLYTSSQSVIFMDCELVSDPLDFDPKCMVVSANLDSRVVRKFLFLTGDA